MTCTSYCKRIEEILNTMISLSDKVLPENRGEVTKYIRDVWAEGTTFTRSIKWEEGTAELRAKFQLHVDAEEERLRKNFEDTKYRIDGYDSVRLISYGRIETVWSLAPYLCPAKSRIDSVPNAISSSPERFAEDPPCLQARSFRLRTPRRSRNNPIDFYYRRG